MKTLIIVAHPNLDDSIVNRRWIEALDQSSELFTVHDIYKAYPDGIIDVKKEQALVESHGSLVFQFPIFWFNCPPLLKQWLDEVFLYGWAYGSKGTALQNRKVALAVSAGIKLKDYTREGRYHFTLEEVLRPFEITMHYVKANYQPFFAIYGGEDEQGASYQWNNKVLEDSSKAYIEFLIGLTNGSCR